MAVEQGRTRCRRRARLSDGTGDGCDVGACVGEEGGCIVDSVDGSGVGNSEGNQDGCIEGTGEDADVGCGEGAGRRSERRNVLGTAPGWVASAKTSAAAWAR
jgi:hypothetical protein